MNTIVIPMLHVVCQIYIKILSINDQKKTVEGVVKSHEITKLKQNENTNKM